MTIARSRCNARHVHTTEPPPGRLNLGAPPRVAPVRADLFRGPIFGRPVILDGPEGHEYEHRAVSELLRELDGDYVVVVTNEQFYGWLNRPEVERGERPRRGVAWPASLVYVER